jgi:hypothetical protein
MRRALPLLAIIASSVLFMAATPNPASAANCTGASIGPVVYNGSWYYDVQLTGCTGTSGAAFMGVDWGTMTKMIDLSTHVTHVTNAGTLTYFVGLSTYDWNGPTFAIWGQGCGFPPFNVQQYFGYRLRNSVGNTWGSWHQAGYRTQALC